MTLNIETVYPSIDEILPDILRARVPELLCTEISERYSELGPKYMTDQENKDGRKVNGCMFKSSIQDALEEVVDAAFNTLVWIFKSSVDGHGIPDSAYTVLMGLIEIYSLLVVERHNERI